MEYVLKMSNLSNILYKNRIEKKFGNPNKKKQRNLEAYMQTGFTQKKTLTNSNFLHRYIVQIFHYCGIKRCTDSFSPPIEHEIMEMKDIFWFLYILYVLLLRTMNCD